MLEKYTLHTTFQMYSFYRVLDSLISLLYCMQLVYYTSIYISYNSTVQVV